MFLLGEGSKRMSSSREGKKDGRVVKRKCWQERERFSVTGVRRPSHSAEGGTKRAGTSCNTNTGAPSAVLGELPAWSDGA